jgi:hypothetical protein
MPRSLVNRAGPLAVRRVLAADATYFKISLVYVAAHLVQPEAIH